MKLFSSRSSISGNESAPGSIDLSIINSCSHSHRKSLLLIFPLIGDAPPIYSDWNQISNSDTDLWQWLPNKTPRGSVVTLLILGKDDFRVRTDHSKVLDQRTQLQGIQARLIICHDEENQECNGNNLSQIWVSTASGLVYGTRSSDYLVLLTGYITVGTCRGKSCDLRRI